MTDPFKLCEHCGGWIATNTTHYVIIEYGDKRVYAHYNPCMQRIIEKHPHAFIAEEHVNRRR